MASARRKMNPARWLVLGVWLIGVAVHLLIFVTSDEAKQGTEWYASLPAYRMAMFGMTRFPLWVFALCLLVVAMSRMLRVRK